MTQNGGLDVLAACCMFGVLLALLGWVVLRHHDDPVERALETHDESAEPAGESDHGDGDDHPADDETGADRPDHTSAPQ